MTAERGVRVTRRIAAPPEVVYAYLVEPDKLARWLGASCCLDPRPGGLFVMQSPNGMTARGRVVEVSAPHKLSFTWGWDGDDAVAPGSTIVEIVVIADGEGSLVTLTHRGLPAPIEALHRLGWDHYLTRLAVAGAGGDPGPDPGAG